MLARQLAPNTLFRGRGMGGKREDGGYGDYDTPEETFPDKPVPGNWQVRAMSRSIPPVRGSTQLRLPPRARTPHGGYV